MVYNNNWNEGLEKLINFEAATSSFSANRREDEERFAKIVHDLTGDWYKEIDCELLVSDTRYFTNEVVYFGQKEDFEGDFKAYPFLHLSQIDRYYDGRHADFLANTDKECRDRLFGEEHGSIIGLFNRGTDPAFGEVSHESNLDLDLLKYTMNKKMIYSMPTEWS